MKFKFSDLSNIAVIIVILLTGCRSKDPEEISSTIQVSYPISQEMPVGSGISIELTNRSNYCVVFPIVTGMKIYAEQGGNRVEVKNLITVIGDENLVLNPQGEILSKRSIDIAPDTSNITITEPTQFFVSQSGYLCDDNNVQIQKEIPFTVIP
jgi:hypothetical protein